MSYTNTKGEYPDYPPIYRESWMNIIAQSLPFIQPCGSKAEALKIRAILNTVRHQLKTENSPFYPELRHIRICVKENCLVFETTLLPTLYALAGRPIPPEARFGHQNFKNKNEAKIRSASDSENSPEINNKKINGENP